MPLTPIVRSNVVLLIVLGCTIAASAVAQTSLLKVADFKGIITSNATEERRHLAKLPLVKGGWTDWVVHVRWSAEKKGFWTIWKDGAEVVNERDIVTQYPEALGPYAKLGQYHSVGEASQNVVFFDEYRVAGPSGSYELVAPAGKPALNP